MHHNCLLHTGAAAAVAAAAGGGYAAAVAAALDDRAQLDQQRPTRPSLLQPAATGAPACAAASPPRPAGTHAPAAVDAPSHSSRPNAVGLYKDALPGAS